MTQNKANITKPSRTDILFQKLKLSKSPNTFSIKPHKESDLILRIDELQSFLTQHSDQTSTLLQELSLSLTKLDKTISDQFTSSSKTKVKSSETIEKIKQKMNKANVDHIKSRQESDNYLLSSIEEGVGICKHAIIEEEKEYKKAVEEIEAVIEENVGRVEGIVKKEKHEREMTHQQIKESTEKLVGEIEEDLRAVEGERKQIVGSIREMLGQLEKSTREQIEEECRGREETESSILMLIENMYDKIMMAD